MTTQGKDSTDDIAERSCRVLPFPIYTDVRTPRAIWEYEQDLRAEAKRLMAMSQMWPIVQPGAT